MNSTRAEEEDRNKPVTGYPAAQNSYNPNTYPSAQPNYHQHHPPAAYPYTAPPPAAYYNPNYNPNAYPTPSRGITFLRRVIIMAITFFFIFGAITFIVWLVLRPRLPQFRVDSVSVSNLNVSDTKLTADWDINFYVANPNKKMNVYYDRIAASVDFRDDTPLAENVLAPFYQGKRNQTTLQAKFSASEVFVGSVDGRVIADQRSRGEVTFNLRLLAWVRFRSGAWQTRRHYMRVFCRNLKIGFSSKLGAAGTGTLLGGPRECQVVI